MYVYDDTTHYSLGLAFMYTNRFAEAEECFIKALGGDADSYYYKDALERCQQMAVEYRELQEQAKD